MTLPRCNGIVDGIADDGIADGIANGVADSKETRLEGKGGRQLSDGLIFMANQMATHFHFLIFVFVYQSRSSCIFPSKLRAQNK